jgi:redox-sensing transcriptional repressor
MKDTAGKRVSMTKKNNPRRGSKNIPDPAVARLTRYLRAFTDFVREGRTPVSSSDLSAATGINSSQVRKDLATFGSFGQRGIGYDVKTLDAKMREILGLNRSHRLALVGVGHLGMALLQYGGFVKAGFCIEAAFDQDPSKIGWELEGVRIWSAQSLRTVVRDRKLEIGVVAVPASQAQAVADVLVDAGIKAILNFAPCLLAVPKSVLVRGVDLSSELEHLTYFLGKSKKTVDL